MSAHDAVVRLLGSRPVAATWARVRTGLRVLAYHGVPDPIAFDHQMAYLASRYRAVSARSVAAAARGDEELEPRAVWVTLDDGNPDVLEHGLGVLRRHGVPATLFVCPGLIGTHDPFWWQTVNRAVENGVAADGGLDPAARRHLKRCPDEERRDVVARLAEELRSRGISIGSAQLDWPDLDRWVDAGHTIGNHTWDHPCLDQCDAATQETQIIRAHEALEPYLRDVRTFAYPNGNWSATAEAVLERLGYDVGLVFDHRIAAATSTPLRMSRLRIDSDASLGRFRAVLSGAHSDVFALAAKTGKRS